MASVDLADLIEDLVFKMSAPGVDAFSNVGEDEWVSRLRDGFWTGFNEGLFSEYIEVDGIVSHRTDSSKTFPREFQQLVMMYTSINALTRQLLTFNTNTRYKAGSVEYETQQSATLLNNILSLVKEEKDAVIEAIRRGDFSGATYVIDSYESRQEAYRTGKLSWVGY